MSCITREVKKQIVAQAFDEAADAVKEGHPDVAQKILERALPKNEALVLHEALIVVHGGDDALLEN